MDEQVKCGLGSEVTYGDVSEGCKKVSENRKTTLHMILCVLWCNVYC